MGRLLYLYLPSENSVLRGFYGSKLFARYFVIKRYPVDSIGTLGIGVVFGRR